MSALCRVRGAHDVSALCALRGAQLCSGKLANGCYIEKHDVQQPRTSVKR